MAIHQKRGFLRGAALPLLTVVFLTFFLSCATTKTGGKRASGDTLTIVAVGDNLLHKELINYAALGNGSFDFSAYYTEVRDSIREADIAFINQETLIAGETFGYSGYPRFNGPQEVGDALVDAGFTVINHASNHAMDKGADAVQAVIDYWKQKPGITVLGIHESEATRRTPRLVTRKGITIGFLAYTYGLNGIPLPKDKPYLVSLIDTEVMAEDIARIRPLCDVLVVSMHWGSEYEHTPSAEQEQLAAFLAAQNVDMVIGHHPHVLQPVRFLPKADGGRMLCYFSLGNFISAQNQNPRLLGGMMRVTLKKDALKGTVRVVDAQLIPLVTHYEAEHRNFKVYFLDHYTPQIAETHALNLKNNLVNKAFFKNIVQNIFGASNIFSDGANRLAAQP